MTDEQPNPSQTDPPARNAAMDETLAPDNTDTATDAEFTTDSIPDSLGRYTIKKLLGRGGMGAVYLAHDSQLDRNVALKVPKFDAKTNEKSIKRFYREARSAANLSHPNLCQVFDVGEIDGTHYIAMAFIKGRPLSDYVNADKPPSPRVTAGIVRKVAAAMHDAHQSGIIHRDIKPANIMIDHRNEPIVMDFGLAVAQENETESRLTQDGALIGSPAYMSPEQLRGELDAIGPASDVYALGVVLYELLSGRLPFDGSGSTIAMIGQILTKDAPDLKGFRQDLDPQIIAICTKAISKDAAERYSSMKELAAALTAYLKPKSGEAKSGASKSGASKSGAGTQPGTAQPATGQSTKTVTVAQVQINEKAKLAKTLCDSRQLAAAVPILEQIIDSPDSKGSKALEYAKSMLPKVKQELAKQTAAKTAPVLQAADDPFADLPATPAAGAPAYRPPPARKKPKSKQSAPNKGLLAGLGAIAALGCIGLGFVFWPKDTLGPDITPTTDIAVSNNTTTADATTIAVEPTVAAEPAPQPIRQPNRPRDEGGFQDRPGRGGRLESQLAEFDKDSDGEVLLTDVPGPLREQFRLADHNRDGMLGKGEIEDLKRLDRERRQGGPGRRADDRSRGGGNGPRGGGPDGPRGSGPDNTRGGGPDNTPRGGPDGPRGGGPDDFNRLRGGPGSRQN